LAHDRDLYIASTRPDQPKLPFPMKDREFILKDKLPVFLFCSIRPVFFSKKIDDFTLTNIQFTSTNGEHMALSFSCSDGRIINLLLEREKDHVSALFCLSYESTGSNDGYYRDRVNRFDEIFKNKIKKLKRACHDCIYGPKYNLTKECSDIYQQYEKLDD
jgi:hypothetical protein